MGLSGAPELKQYALRFFPGFERGGLVTVQVKPGQIEGFSFSTDASRVNMYVQREGEKNARWIIGSDDNLEDWALEKADQDIS